LLAGYILATWAPEKFALAQANPANVSRYRLCAVRDRLDEAVLDAIQPDLACDASAAPSTCPSGTDIPCEAPLELEPGTGRISDAAWARIKRLSLVPWVTRIQGCP